MSDSPLTGSTPHPLPAGYARAGRGDFLRLSWANAVAFYARKPRGLRWLLPFFWLGKAPTFYGWMAAHEVYRAGHASSVVMTVHKGDRRGRRAGYALLFGAILVLVVGTSVATLVLPLAVSGAITWAVLALLLLVMTALLVGSLPRHSAPEEKSTVIEYSDLGRVVLLHDLARSTRDVKGTGTALLAAVIHDRTFDDATIVASAVTDAVAAGYCDAGMQRIVDGSRVVVRAAAGLEQRQPAMTPIKRN